jgi:Ca2+-binding EF-hand superfamily protein
MTHGEIKAIFKIADRNEDGKLDTEEWHHFFQIFVWPF